MNNNFSEPKLFNWAGAFIGTQLFYGPLIKGENSGKYYHILYGGSSGRYIISMIKTNDYWNTYKEVGILYDGTIPYTETEGYILAGVKCWH